jgi:hypothetical protein
MLVWPKDHNPGFDARRCEIVRDIELNAFKRWVALGHCKSIKKELY